MKNVLITLMMLFSITANAQFLLTPNGFVDSLDTSKSYVVLNAADKSQQDLYIATKTYIISKYNSPKNVISENMPISLSIYGHKDIVAKTMGMPLEHSLNYKIVFTFKDGKIKVEPYIVSYTTSEGLDIALFSKQGEIRKVTRKLHSAAQDYINDIVNSLYVSIENPQEDEW